MRIHHLNLGTMCPVGGSLMGRPKPGIGPARLTCHCLLLETTHGLVLVDTGLGTRDVTVPEARLSRFFIGLMRPRFDLDETAVRQVRRLGFSLRDVRHIVLTHLDFDHAGGLSDFPHARVHLLGDEVAAAHRRQGLLGRRRYRPDQWPSEQVWETYVPDGGERWFEFACVRALVGLPPEILLVPLAGHTEGHAGVAVRDSEGWLLHAGDAYFHRREVDPFHTGCPVGLRAYQRMMEVNREARLANQRRLRELARAQGDAVRIHCAHDPVEFDLWEAAGPHGEAPPVRLVPDPPPHASTRE